MAYVSHYHLYLDELHRPEELPSSKLFMNGECRAENDIDIELAKPLLQQNWENVWHRKLRSSSADEEKQLHVCGSRFGQLFFEAIARTQKDFKCSEDNSSAPFSLLNISFSERVERFAALCKKHNFSRTSSFVVNIERVRGGDGLLQELSSVFRKDGVFPVRFAVDEATADLSLYVATSFDEAVELGKNAEIVLILDTDADSVKVDNCLFPRHYGHYFWAFNTIAAFKDVIGAYIESTLIAPAFMKLLFAFWAEKFGELTPEEIKEWLTLSRNRPFSYAMLPVDGVVEKPFWIELGSVGTSTGDAPALLLADDCDGLCESYRDSGRMAFTPSRVGTYHARWESRNERQCIIVSVTNGGVPNVIVDGDVPIEVENHGLTTSVELHDASGHYYKWYKMPADGSLVLDVVATNKYDSSLTPIDADEWQWELSEDGANVERNGSQLTFRPTRAGYWSLRVFWRGQDDDVNSSKEGALVVWKPVHSPCATVDVSVLNRAEAICVKIDPLPKKGHPPFKVEYLPWKVYAECFPGDGFAMSAWLEGNEPLWNREVRVEGLTGIESWDDKDKVFKRGFGKPGKKEFKVMSIDDSDNLIRFVEINYKVNHSDTTRGWMIPCMILAVLSAVCSYGLNWFNFILYMSPMCVAAIHFKLKLPMYRRLMGIMFVVAALLFLHALWQEVF